VASFNPLVIFGFLSAALVLISAILVWEYLVWKNYDFFFGDDNLNIKHGVISKNTARYLFPGYRMWISSEISSRGYSVSHR